MKYLKAFQNIVDNADLGFSQKLEAFEKIFQSNDIGRSAIEAYDRLSRDLHEHEVESEALNLGETIPGFELPDSFGKSRNLKELHTEPWLVISFYRGQFCPFCNLELKSLQTHLSEIEGCPARLVAISPQKVEHSLDTVYRNKLTYTVLSDADTVVGKLFGVAFVAPDFTIDFHLRTGVPKDYLDEQGKLRLFIPATYIIDSDHIIRYRFLKLHPAKRMNPAAIAGFIKNQTK